MLPHLDTLAAKLEMLFHDDGAASAGLRLCRPGSSPQALNKAQEALDYELPESLCSVATEYQLGGVALGVIAFGRTAEYANDLIEMNTQRWWGDETSDRPSGLIMVAGGDPYSILADSRGTILAFDVEQTWTSAEPVAATFDLFVRGLGTALVRRAEGMANKSTAVEIANETRGSFAAFWDFATLLRA